MKIDLADIYRGTALGQEAESLLQPCVQCGQCTFVCPTFRLLGDEWDGPRGRIFLIKHRLEGKEPLASQLPPAYSLDSLRGKSLSANLRLRLDRCLTCRSCEAHCPQGVKYGRLLDIGRAVVENDEPRPVGERLARWAVRAIVPHRTRFAILLRAGQSLRRILPKRLQDQIPARRSADPWPNRPHSRTMLIWQGCVQPTVAPDINAATARVLDRMGIRPIAAKSGCCGAISHHLTASGDARGFMRQTMDELWPFIEAGVEAIVLTASGCGSHFRDYVHLFRDDPSYAEKAARISAMVKDIAEVVSAEWREYVFDAPSRLPKLRVAVQSSCSLQHSQKLNGVVEKILRRAGFKLAPVTYPFMCCGAAGAYSLLQSKISTSLRKLKLDALMACRPQAIATANIGCLAHLSPVAPVPVRHWIELFDSVTAQAGVGSRSPTGPAMEGLLEALSASNGGVNDVSL